MIIYWETLEKNAGDASVLPQYMATDYFGGPGRIKSEDAYPLSPPYGAIRFQPATNQFLGFKKDSGWSALGGEAVEPSVDGWIEAGHTLVYASADDPTFTFTIADLDATTILSVGMRIKLTQTSVKYFIITKIVFDDPGSTITVYGGTDYNLVDAEITLPYYSTNKAPLDFPLDPDKWTVKVTDVTNRSQSTPTSAVWYNLGSITVSIPIGVWRTYYKVSAGTGRTSTSIGELYVTLSTADNSESDADLTVWVDFSSATAALYLYAALSAEKTFAVTSKTSYYLNTMTLGGISISNINSKNKLIIRAICAYL